MVSLFSSLFFRVLWIVKKKKRKIRKKKHRKLKSGIHNGDKTKAGIKKKLNWKLPV